MPAMISRIALQSQIQCLGDGLAREVVFGRTEAPAENYDVRTVESVLSRLDQMSSVRRLLRF